MSASHATLEDTLREQLNQRALKGTLRKLSHSDPNNVDFSSNDYLGLARSQELLQASQAEMARAMMQMGVGPVVGSGGSRLLAGNSTYTEDLEEWLARFHSREAALLFNSGYAANQGLLSSVPQRGDRVIYDELVHNSMHAGVGLGRQSDTDVFRHNDLQDLHRLLSEPRVGNTIIAVESVYSMSGECAPLAELLHMAARFGAHVIVDEAHATGVLGRNGEGMLSEQGLEQHPALLCSMHTFGKALGAHGAVVVCSSLLRQYLINYARVFIYSTALPLHSLATIKAAYLLQRNKADRRAKVLDLAKLFRSRLTKAATSSSRRFGEAPPLSETCLSKSHTPIQAVIIPGNERVVRVATLLKEQGMDVMPIRSPTVPEGLERLRVCLHATNTHEEIKTLALLIREFVADRRGRSLGWKGYSPPARL
ncbi:unnamed protein product [Chrysoparadoxa australica]